VEERTTGTEYAWKPTARRTATSDLGVVAGRVGPRPAQARPAQGPTGRARPAGIGVAAAIEQFIDAASDDRVVNRSGRPYQPSALRDLVGLLRHHVVAELGDLRLRAVTREHVQALVDRLAASGLSESRIRSVVSALRALHGWAIDEGLVETSPVDGLVMPRRKTVTPPSQLAWAPDPTGWDTDSVWTWGEDRARGRAREERREQRDLERDEGHDRDDYRPFAFLSDGVLGLALRAALVLLILLAIVSLIRPSG
jgi:hypothetical protein